jgi:hypothetical protein
VIPANNCTTPSTCPRQYQSTSQYSETLWSSKVAQRGGKHALFASGEAAVRDGRIPRATPLTPPPLGFLLARQTATIFHHYR